MPLLAFWSSSSDGHCLRLPAWHMSEVIEADLPITSLIRHFYECVALLGGEPVAHAHHDHPELLRVDESVLVRIHHLVSELELEIALLVQVALAPLVEDLDKLVEAHATVVDARLLDRNLTARLDRLENVRKLGIRRRLREGGAGVS